FAADTADCSGSIPALTLSRFFPAGTAGGPLCSCIVMSASAGIFDSMALHNTSLTNSEYLLTLLGDLLGKDDAVSIQPKSLAGKTLGITSGQVTTLGVLLAGVLPLLILGTGVVVWLVRRHR
ncbi:MAG: hypothetical protein FWF86_06970, partial [Clostridia bacterium]|nr:hypothetical protein [Clostridia bacterium]